MLFDEWPRLSEGCPICSGVQCAIYKGYYIRLMYCPELEYVGPVVIRTGMCKSQRTCFSFLPDFLFRFKRISKFSFQSLHECYREQKGRLQSCIDILLEGLGEEFYLPLATAYVYLQYQFLPP